MEQPLEHDTIAWDAPEYHHDEKPSDWYWIVGTVAISVAIIAILFKNILFSLFILLAAATGAMYAHRKPQNVHIEIGPTGILMGKTLYPYDSLESFWIEDFIVHPFVLVKSKRTFMPYIIVPLGDTSHEAVHQVLSQYLPEVEQHEPLAQRLLEHLGF